MMINIIAEIIVFVLCAGIIGSPTLLFIWIRKKIKKKKKYIILLRLIENGINLRMCRHLLVH